MLEIFAPFSPVSYMLSLSQKLPHFQSQAIAPLWGWQVWGEQQRDRHKLGEQPPMKDTHWFIGCFGKPLSRSYNCYHLTYKLCVHNCDLITIHSCYKINRASWPKKWKIPMNQKTSNQSKSIIGLRSHQNPTCHNITLHIWFGTQLTAVQLLVTQCHSLAFPRIHLLQGVLTKEWNSLS